MPMVDPEGPGMLGKHCTTELALALGILNSLLLWKLLGPSSLSLTNAKITDTTTSWLADRIPGIQLHLEGDPGHALT